MCLTWCHVRQRVFNSDVSCDCHCPSTIRLAHVGRTCQSCEHMISRGLQRPLCGLTRQPTPYANSCCHWDATISTGVRFVGPTDLVDGLLEATEVSSTALLFMESWLADGAPEVQPEGDGVYLRVEELALPEVYGVPAYQWDEAIPYEDVEPGVLRLQRAQADLERLLACAPLPLSYPPLHALLTTWSARHGVTWPLPEATPWADPMSDLAYIQALLLEQSLNVIEPNEAAQLLGRLATHLNTQEGESG
jgi:hypothetical protein